MSYESPPAPLPVIEQLAQVQGALGYDFLDTLGSVVTQEQFGRLGEGLAAGHVVAASRVEFGKLRKGLVAAGAIAVLDQREPYNAFRDLMEDTGASPPAYQYPTLRTPTNRQNSPIP